MERAGFREGIVEFIGREAKPPDKLSHQARLYALACRLAEGKEFDQDVLYAAAWMHDLGVFIGHRPEDPQALAQWDHLAYTLDKTPAILRECGFPESRISEVLEVIRTHTAHAEPASFEGDLLHDADILEQLGAVGILRTVSKVGRDTRFPKFSNALAVLEKNARELPPRLRLNSARKLAAERLQILNSFLAAAAAETGAIAW